MHHHNTPIAVWHSQPFEVPVLDAGMRWALVKYRNPREQPRKFSWLKNWFIVRQGQNFGAVGNEACTSIRVWQFRWWIGWPISKRIELSVRKLSERRMPDVSASTPIPGIHPQVAHELERATLLKQNTPHIEMHIRTKVTLQLPSCNLQLKNFTDLPALKTFQDTL
jgi:hypothetical protein